MLQSQHEPPDYQHPILAWARGSLFQHPLLRRRAFISLVLLIGSLALSIASLFPDSLFPVLTLLSIPSAQLCLTFAFVLGISGVLISIISIIEHVDRYWSQAAMFPKSKEHGYVNRN